MKFRFEKNVTALLEGSIDIHIHSAPDVYPRLLNDVELAFSAKENGMRDLWQRLVLAARIWWGGRPHRCPDPARRAWRIAGERRR